MRAEELDQRITLQPLTNSRGADGSVIKDYTQNNITVWANYVARSGKEFYAAQKQNAETQAVFKIRYQSDIDTTWRIVHNNRTFEILFVDDTRKRKNELILACREVV